MDAKITKLRLSRMLSYDWIKIVAIAVAAIIVWTLIFTMTATRITPAQEFTVMNYIGNVSNGSTGFHTLYQKSFKDGVYSHEVIELKNYDLAASAEYAGTLMQAYVSTDDGDVIFAADIPDPTFIYKDKDGKEQKGTYLDSLLLGYRYNLYNLDLEAENGFFKKMEKYLAGYYVGGDFKSETAVLDTAKIKSDFLARIERTGDKRYKTDEKLQAGIKGENERIIKYRNALLEFYGYLEEGIISLTAKELSVIGSTGGVSEIKGTYAINLCPDELTMKNLYKTAAYVGTTKDENGADQKVLMAKDMHICIFDMPGTEEGFQYEPLLFINYVIRNSRTVAENSGN